MSWKDLYSEVKKRKMEALNKGEVVKAVEKHGRILAVEGKYEKPKKVVSHMYAAERKVIPLKRIRDVMNIDFSYWDVILIGCPGSEIPTTAYPKIRDYVYGGGWLITTDWALDSIVENIFPGYIRWNKRKTRGRNKVVACQVMEPNHPFLDGVVSEIQQSKWVDKSMKDTKAAEFRWWLEIGSYPIQVLNYDAVKVLISSWELKNKYGEAPVFVYFDYGNGRVIHMISHTHLQKGGAKGKYASALIITNILDEKVAQKVGIAKKPAQGYVADWDSPQPQQPRQQSLDAGWTAPPQQAQGNYLNVTPTTVSGSGLTGTAQIVEINANDPNFSFGTQCSYCTYDFGEYTGKIYKCNACGALYHENCINMQVNEGVCKKCNSILLW